MDQILQWPSPTTPRDLRRFVGFASYYRESIPRFAELTAEMNSVKNRRSPEWTDALERDFQELKKCFDKYRFFEFSLNPTEKSIVFLQYFV